MKTTKIKLPFGLNKDNVMVHIADAERGRKCDCICPSCRSQLIAVKGEKNQAHFRHAIVNECVVGFESVIHLAAKQIIKEKMQITLPKHSLILTKTDPKGKRHTVEKKIVENGTLINFDSIQTEVDIGGMRADLLAKIGKHQLIIEIRYTHKVDDQKRSKIIDAKTSAIEINLSDLEHADINNWEEFWGIINNPRRIHWLHNIKDDNYREELEKQLIKKIEYEEIRKQKQEQRETPLFLQALDNLKNLSSEKNIARFQQEAKTHPSLKYLSSHLPFSLQNLPDYVNANVPHGDWIFGCARHIWQIAIYDFFIWKHGKLFSVTSVSKWLQKTVGCQVHQDVKSVAKYKKSYSELVPSDIYNSLPSAFGTLCAYFRYLRELGMLGFYYGDSWFVISKTPVTALQNKVDPLIA